MEVEWREAKNALSGVVEDGPEVVLVPGGEKLRTAAEAGAARERAGERDVVRGAERLTPYRT